MKQDMVACIDLKAFYASVECVERNLDPFTTPLVVCDIERGPGTIVLSVTPYLKSKGIPSRLRRRDLPKIDGLIYAFPQMQLYIEKSCEVLSIIMDFIAKEDIHVYSIDECFVNLTPYLKFYNKTGEEIIDSIQKAIKEKLGLTATAGISYNMFMAKAALDNEGKNLKPNYRATWYKEDVQNKLWKIKNMKDLRGISNGYSTKLKKLGIDSIEKLANTPSDFLKFHFGIMGEQLHDLANGIDDSNIRDKYIPMATSFSCGHTLFEDYNVEDAKLLIREITDELCIRLHKNNRATKTISLTIIYTYTSKITGFSQQMTLDVPTDDNNILYENIINIYNKNIKHIGIRRVYVHFGNLFDASIAYQPLFIEEDLEKNKKAIEAVELIKDKYGLESISRGTSLLKKSVFRQRSNQIGGHRK